MGGWGFETSLDVEYAHAMAPGANILLVETPVDETLGVQGFPQMIEAENYVIRHRLGDVISQSFGATEQTFPRKSSILALRSAYFNALVHRVTVLSASGDGGATDDSAYDTSTGAVNYYPFQVDSWPSSDPLVTSVGGTQLHLDGSGNRTAPDNVWNDTALFGGPAAGGGGVSTVFKRPDFQNGVARVVGSARGTPDVSMTAAAVDGGVVVYLGYTNTAYGVSPGWYVVGGTSEATPVFSGIVAIADQAAHHGLWRLNPTLYALGDGSRSGIADITAATTRCPVPSNCLRSPVRRSRSRASTPYLGMTWPVASARPTGLALSARWPAPREHGAATEKAHWAGPTRAGPIPPGPRHPECQTVPRPSSPSMPRADSSLLAICRPFASVAGQLLLPTARAGRASSVKDAHVTWLGLQRLAVESQHEEEEHPAREEQADDDQNGNARLVWQHEHKQRDDQPCQRADRDW